MLSSLTNEQVLLHVLGWSRGSLQELAIALMVTPETIANADADVMNHLCEVAKKVAITQTF